MTTTTTTTTMTAVGFFLFSFAGITATIDFSNYDAAEGCVNARGFDMGGDYHEANVMYFGEYFTGAAERDQAIANAMKFVAKEMQKQADWQAA